MRRAAGWMAVAALGALAPAAVAAESFSHKDWELACDNTGVCRAAGYQRDSDENAVSVLLTRQPGPGTAIDAQVQTGSYGDDAAAAPAKARLTIAGKPAGTVELGAQTNEAALSPAQVAALLKALTGSGDIVFSGGKSTWRLSGDGAAAVLLKMDEAQGRLGTPGAIVRKGAGNEAGVPGPRAEPVVQAVRVAAPRDADKALAARIRPALAAGAPDCTAMEEADNPEPPTLWRLDAGRVLVSATCSRGAYNVGTGYWIANDKPPYDPHRVTDMATDFDPASGTLSSAMKGRGLGDCWGSEEWVWNGREFVQTAESSTGLCRLVAPGGAWELPTLVTRVIPAK